MIPLYATVVSSSACASFVLYYTLALMVANQVEMHSTLIFLPDKRKMLAFFFLHYKMLSPSHRKYVCDSGAFVIHTQNASDATKSINLIICVSVAGKLCAMENEFEL